MMKSRKKQKLRVVVAEKKSESRRSLCSLVASLNFEATPICSSSDTIREVTSGNYRAKDFIQSGLPLSFIFCLVSVAAVALLYPDFLQ